MARVPALEKAYGQDRLAQVHRLVGFTSFNLMLAHVVLITWGYAAGKALATPGTLWNLVVDYPGMLRLVEAGTLRPQDLVERVVGLADGARLLPSLDGAAPVGVTLIDPRLP